MLTTHTQIVVGLIQKATYGNKPFNSYEPYYEPINGLKENGQYLISEIKYDDEYPNSYLDITYPDGDLTAWMCWQLRGDTEAAKAFVGDEAEMLSNASWQDVEKDIR